VARTAAERGLFNIDTVPAAAEALPFADGEFDFLACRYSAHHWRDLEAGLRQARRVLKPGAQAVFIDAISPRGALADTHLQAIELLRDPSHGRDYSLAEWSAALERSGFAVTAVATWRIRMDYETWVERMRTPATHRAAIRALQALASDEVRERLAIEPDGSFLLDVALFETRAG
jgi:ubiquinone/menaquinone biosynthesis C-methylase UbiE